MIALFVPAESARAAEIPTLLRWARTLIDDDQPNVTDCRLSGVCSRMALEYHLGELCRRHGPPKGERWHNFVLRLLKADVIVMDDYRRVRRIMRLAAKAVHGKPFDRSRAKLLLEQVMEVVEEM